jgi:NAD(P)-dependent dehydrogenase (short-subunit alcohol dehydrogenase family)
MKTPATIFVTGADRGLGRALVMDFAQRGHRVFAGIHTKRTIQESPFEHPSITPVIIDITNDDSVRTAANFIRDRCASLEVLVNNAGRLGDIEVPIDGPLDFDDILASINTNAIGPLRVTNAVIELMKRGTLRSILNISSEAASIGDQTWRKAWFGYCMSKAALNMGSVLCFNQLREQGFSIKLVHPGYLRTYMHGAKNMKATYEPEEVSNFICTAALTPNHKDAATVPFIDKDGKTLPW